MTDAEENIHRYVVSVIFSIYYSSTRLIRNRFVNWHLAISIDMLILFPNKQNDFKRCIYYTIWIPTFLFFVLSINDRDKSNEWKMTTTTDYCVISRWRLVIQVLIDWSQNFMQERLDTIHMLLSFLPIDCLICDIHFIDGIQRMWSIWSDRITINRCDRFSTIQWTGTNSFVVNMLIALIPIMIQINDMIKVKSFV